jgi:hypothetical protein
MAQALAQSLALAVASVVVMLVVVVQAIHVQRALLTHVRHALVTHVQQADHVLLNQRPAVNVVALAVAKNDSP